MKKWSTLVFTKIVCGSVWHGMDGEQMLVYGFIMLCHLFIADILIPMISGAPPPHAHTNYTHKQQLQQPSPPQPIQNYNVRLHQRHLCFG